MNNDSLIRVEKHVNYTVLDNTFIQDTTLSWKAKGLMCYLLSLPDTWRIYVKELQHHSKDGIDSLRSALKELESGGYIVKHNCRDSNGKFVGCFYKVFEKPSFTANLPHGEKPDTVFPDTVFPDTENPTLLNTNTYKILKEENTDMTRSSHSHVSEDLNSNIAEEESDGERNHEPDQSESVNSSNVILPKGNSKKIKHDKSELEKNKKYVSDVVKEKLHQKKKTVYSVINNYTKNGDLKKQLRIFNANHFSTFKFNLSPERLESLLKCLDEQTEDDNEKIKAIYNSVKYGWKSFYVSHDKPKENKKGSYHLDKPDNKPANIQLSNKTF